MSIRQDLIELGEKVGSHVHRSWAALFSSESCVGTARARSHSRRDASPRPCDIMVEAAMYIAHLRHPERELTREERDWFAACPCGEDH